MKTKSLSNRAVQWAFGSTIAAVLIVSAMSYSINDFWLTKVKLPQRRQSG
jgi:hypothetical protein